MYLSRKFQLDEFSYRQRGIYFEINYSDLLSLKDAEKRRQVISNAKVRNSDSTDTSIKLDILFSVN